MKTVIDVKDWTIGPAHDPYGATSVRITHGDVTATRYWDGFGREWFSIMRDGDRIHYREWMDGGHLCNITYCNHTLANMYARRYTGTTFSDAFEEFWSRDQGMYEIKGYI